MPIQKGGTVEVGGIKVTATNAFHSSSIRPRRRQPTSTVANRWAT